ncbi:MAG: FMN-binding protein [Clostridia bacterium]
MKKKQRDWLILCVITLLAATLLALTNFVTVDTIQAQAAEAAEQARMIALPTAKSFAAVDGDQLGELDSCVVGLNADGAVAGYVGQVTVQGFAGPLEIVMGIDETGMVTGMSVGGSGFAETAGLGTQVKEEKFTSQFVGNSMTPVAGENVDTISGATVSSAAVVQGAAKCYDHLVSHIEGYTPTASKASPTTDVSVTAHGFGGDFEIVVTIDSDGIVQGVKVGEGFNEHPDYGAKCLDEAFLSQFIGHGAGMSYGLDAISGATGTSNTILTAVNDALTQWAAQK